MQIKKVSTRSIKSFGNVLESFDRMPDSGFVRLPIVCGLFGIGPATAWRWSKEGRLPAPHKFSPRVTSWSVRELRALLRSR